MKLFSIAVAVLLCWPHHLTAQARVNDTERAKQEAEQVMDPLLSIAASLLEKHGEFYPIGGYLSSDGRFTVAGFHGGSENPTSDEVIRDLRRVFTQTAAKAGYRAVGLAYDVRVTPPRGSGPTDAVLVELEHANGYRVNVYWPYRRPPNGPPIFGDAFAVAGTLRTFSP